MANFFLITYDIASPKRLRRIHRALKKRAMPVQYSVFLACLGAADLNAVDRLIRDIIDPHSDDVRIYPLPVHGWRRQMGRPTLPQGVHFSLLPDVFQSPVVDKDALNRNAVNRPCIRHDPPATKPQSLSGPVRRMAHKTRTGTRSGIRIIQ